MSGALVQPPGRLLVPTEPIGAYLALCPFCSDRGGLFSETGIARHWERLKHPGPPYRMTHWRRAKP